MCPTRRAARTVIGSPESNCVLLKLSFDKPTGSRARSEALVSPSSQTNSSYASQRSTYRPVFLIMNSLRLIVLCLRGCQQLLRLGLPCEPPGAGCTIRRRSRVHLKPPLRGRE